MKPIDTTRRILKIDRGTDLELVGMAEVRARLAARRLRSAGWDDERIRRAVVGAFRSDIETESFGVYEDETLMAAVQRGIQAVLSERQSA